MSHFQAGVLLVMVYLIWLAVMILGIFCVARSATWTTHVGGHECLVVARGFAQSISCNWGKP